MIRIHDISIPPIPEAERRTALEKKLRGLFEGRIPEYRIMRRSVDARKKDAICYVYTVDVKGESRKAEEAFLRRHKKLKAEIAAETPYSLPASGTEILPGNVYVLGAGPAGLFAAYELAKAGYRPMILEQGAPVEERTKDVKVFWAGGKLDPKSNVQFGEGGAGTFSDGKLNTGIKDPSGRIGEVLEVFHRFGAPESITYDAKPHIGTDVLAAVIVNLRKEIIALGGTFRFHTQLTDIKAENGRLCGISLTDTRTGTVTECPAGLLILAPGHSARETFPMLKERGLSLEAKAFAVGVRIQHPQEQINLIQYGIARPENLPAADYKLTAKAKDGRGVYSFCMCPGGQVVNASSEEERLCVNGMSVSARDGINANAALIVQVFPEDFGEEGGIFAGMAFQRRLEEAAYAAAGGQIPVQLLDDFTKGRKSATLKSVCPDFGGLWAFGDLRKVLPEYVTAALIDAFPQFDRKMPGYARDDALLAGVEARTSSPLRILRDEGFESTVKGIYPCGEGAGYAGGITSAAVDGIKTAEKIIERFRPE